MIKKTFALLLEEKCPGKPANIAPAQCAVGRGAAGKLAVRSVMILAFLSLGLFANTARAQFVGITKPFDPANQQQGPTPDAVITGNGIEYAGGPVMLGPHNVYFIWYGNFAGNIALTMLPDLIKGFNGSLYFNTNTTYGDATGNIANTVAMAGQVFDNYSQGTALNSTTFSNAISKPL